MLTFVITEPVSNTEYEVRSLDDYAKLSEKLVEDHGLKLEHLSESVNLKIIGVPFNVELFETANERGCSVEEWLEHVQDTNFKDTAKFYWLLDECGYDFESAVDNFEETTIHSGNLRITAERIFRRLYLQKIPLDLRSYVDYEAFAKDLRYAGTLEEFEFGEMIFTVER